MHYLDDLCSYSDTLSKDVLSEVRTKVQDRFQHTDLGGSLDDAFRIWDAVNDIESTRFDSAHANISHRFTKV